MPLVFWLGVFIFRVVRQGKGQVRMYVDLTGERFGRLLVKHFSFRKRRFNYFECLCDCGNISTVRGTSLLRGDTRSCGLES